MHQFKPTNLKRNFRNKTFVVVEDYHAWLQQELLDEIYEVGFIINRHLDERLVSVGSKIVFLGIERLETNSNYIYYVKFIREDGTVRFAYLCAILKSNSEDVINVIFEVAFDEFLRRIRG